MFRKCAVALSVVVLLAGSVKESKALAQQVVAVYRLVRAQLRGPGSPAVLSVSLRLCVSTTFGSRWMARRLGTARRKPTNNCGAANGLMDAHEIVVHHVQRDGVSAVLAFV
jgi:hypothetical protein